MLRGLAGTVAVMLTAFVVTTSATRPAEAGSGPAVFTNDTGQTAGFLHLQSIVGGSFLPSVNAPGCAAPVVFGAGFEYWEVVWPEPCVDPGESVTFDTSPDPIFSHYWAPTPPVISAVNNTGAAANYLRVDSGGFIKGWSLVANAPGCATPSFTLPSSSQLELTWSSLCVDPNEKVSIHLGTLYPITSAPLVWGPSSVGGVATLSGVTSKRGAPALARAGAMVSAAFVIMTSFWLMRRRLRT